jgi:hypothetical protein
VAGGIFLALAALLTQRVRDPLTDPAAARRPLTAAA